MIIRFFGIDLVIGENNDELDRETEWLLVIFGFIGICLYVNWFYTLLGLGILTIILGCIMFDRSFDDIDKENKGGKQ